MRGDSLNSGKGSREKPIANILVKVRRLNAFPLRPATKQECLTLPLPFNAGVEILVRAITPRQEQKQDIQIRKALSKNNQLFLLLL